LKVIKDSLGDTEITIQPISESLEVLGEGGRATQLTGLRDDVKNGYSKIKCLIREVATDIGSELHAVESLSRPKQVEVEFQIAMSAQIGPVVILGGKGDSTMKVKMIWDLSDNGKSTG
jgi:hypothetical protein